MIRITVVTRIFREAWVLICGGVLFSAVYADRVCNADEVGIALGWAMLALAFPISLIAALVLAAISFGFASVEGLGESSLALLITWSIFFSAGYYQWFVIVPKLSERANRSTIKRKGSST